MSYILAPCVSGVKLERRTDTLTTHGKNQLRWVSGRSEGHAHMSYGILESAEQGQLLYFDSWFQDIHINKTVIIKSTFKVNAQLSPASCYFRL